MNERDEDQLIEKIYENAREQESTETLYGKSLPDKIPPRMRMILRMVVALIKETNTSNKKS